MLVFLVWTWFVRYPALELCVGLSEPQEGPGVGHAAIRVEARAATRLTGAAASRLLPATAMPSCPASRPLRTAVSWSVASRGWVTTAWWRRRPSGAGFGKLRGGQHAVCPKCSITSPAFRLSVTTAWWRRRPSGATSENCEEGSMQYAPSVLSLYLQYGLGGLRAAATSSSSCRSVETVRSARGPARVLDFEAVVSQPGFSLLATREPAIAPLVTMATGRAHPEWCDPRTERCT